MVCFDRRKKKNCASVGKSGAMWIECHCPNIFNFHFQFNNKIKLDINKVKITKNECCEVIQ